MFDVGEFLSPLDPWVVLMAVVLGVVSGFRQRQLGPRLSNSRTFWQLADGFIFFVPLALIRAFEGSVVWERLLATLPLWIIYIAAMRFGNSFEWDRLPGNGHSAQSSHRERRKVDKGVPKEVGRERRRARTSYPRAVCR